VSMWKRVYHPDYGYGHSDSCTMEKKIEKDEVDSPDVV
jgi:hypothetical protein